MTVGMWRQAAGQVIWPIVNHGKGAGLSGVEIMAQIDAAYPFGAREHFPYKEWLRVRREAMTMLGMVDAPTEPRETGPLFAVETVPQPDRLTVAVEAAQQNAVTSWRTLRQVASNTTERHAEILEEAEAERIAAQFRTLEVVW